MKKIWIGLIVLFMLAVVAFIAYAIYNLATGDDEEPANVAQVKPEKPTVATAPTNQVPFYESNWFGRVVVGVIVLIVVILFLTGKIKLSALGPEGYLLLLLLVLIVCWALFFRLDWQFLAWPGTLLPLVIFVCIRQLAFRDWWKAVNHPIAHVYVRHGW